MNAETEQLRAHIEEQIAGLRETIELAVAADVSAPDVAALRVHLEENERRLAQIDAGTLIAIARMPE